MTKTENHITQLPREVDPRLSVALGEMVIAYGRLEDMFKVAIKRLENSRSLEQVINDLEGTKGTIGKLVSYCAKFPTLSDCCQIAQTLNIARQDFIHATFCATDEGQYVRFRKLVGYSNLDTDIKLIIDVTNKVNALIKKLDQDTGRPLSNPTDDNEIIATVSAAGSIK